MSIIDITLSRRGLWIFWILAHVLVAAATALMVLAAIQEITLRNIVIAVPIVLVAQMALAPRVKWKAQRG